jgi:folate-binding protein YgfZ
VVTTPTAALSSLAGAVGADPPDTAVPAHFGDPYAEQRALEHGAALVDRGNRGVLAVSGPDRLSWLHSLTSQHLSALTPGQATEALVLDPHGHVEHHLMVLDDGETTYLDVEPATVDSLAGWLDSMRFLLRVDVAQPPLSVLTLAGPGSQAVLRDVLAVALPAPGSALVTASGAAQVFIRRRSWPAVGVDLLVPTEAVAAFARTLLEGGAAPAGMWAYEALRVAARRPRLGFETDHRTIPHEVGWLETAVHLDKGCYRGQETVARVHNLGRPPRRLVLLQLDGSESLLPPHGADVLTAAGARVGFVTTAVRHYEQGPIALALVKRTVPDDAPLIAGAVPAAIDPLP